VALGPSCRPCGQRDGSCLEPWLQSEHGFVLPKSLGDRIRPHIPLWLRQIFQGLSRKRERKIRPHAVPLQLRKRCSAYPWQYSLSVQFYDVWSDDPLNCLYQRGKCLWNNPL
jgi:hypothetical protein